MSAMVGLHAALIVIMAAFGVYFVADPCGGGGDLCLLGAVGVAAFAYAGIGVGAIITWKLARRASPLLVWDAPLVTLAGATLLATMGDGAAVVMLGLTGVLVVGIPGILLAGREVSPHRVERLLAILALAAAVLFGLAAIVVTVVGLVALGVGYLLQRSSSAEAQPPDVSETPDAAGMAA